MLSEGFKADAIVAQENPPEDMNALASEKVLYVVMPGSISRGPLAHIFLSASTRFDIMVESAQDSIQELQFEYVRSGNNTIAEFEVKAPIYFRVVIEQNPLPDERRLLIPALSRPEGTTLEIRFGIDASEEEQTSGMKYIGRFLRTLVDALPASPWAGIGWWRSRREKKRWNQLMKEAEQVM